MRVAAEIIFVERSIFHDKAQVMIEAWIAENEHTPSMQPAARDHVQNANSPQVNAFPNPPRLLTELERRLDGATGNTPNGGGAIRPDAVPLDAGESSPLTSHGTAPHPPGHRWCLNFNDDCIGEPMIAS